MPNYITMDLIDGYNHARMTSECLDPDGKSDQVDRFKYACPSHCTTSNPWKVILRAGI
jgi:hypothetical protein